MHKKRKYSKFAYFRALAFFRGICLSRHQRIWIQHKILRFLIPILIFFQKKMFWVIIALFVYFKCKCEKNCTFSNILQKVKSCFLPISIMLCLIPIKFETLKPPTMYSRCKQFLVAPFSKTSEILNPTVEMMEKILELYYLFFSRAHFFSYNKLEIYQYCHMQEHADLFPHEEEEREDLFQALSRFVFYAPCLVKMGT